MHRWVLAALSLSAAFAQKLPELHPIPDSKPDLGRAFHDYWRQQTGNRPATPFAVPQGEVKCSVPLIEVEIPDKTWFAIATIKPMPVDPKATIQPPAPPCPQLKK
jgi:hypothetical protein